MFRPSGLLLLLGLLLGVEAHAARWTPLGPNGGTVHALAISPFSGVLWAGTDGGGIWRSGDLGAHWISSSHGLGSPDVYALAVSSTLPQTLWAGTGDGIYKSTDDGALWQRVWYEAAQPADVITPLTLGIAADPSDSDVVWACTYRGWILKTTDGGATWMRLLDVQGTAGRILIDPTDPDTVYTGNSKTTDGGATWQELDSHGGILALAPSNPRILYADGGFEGFWKSLDAGATWIHLPGFQYGIESFVVDPSDPDVLIASHSGVGVLRSKNGGQTWAPVQSLPYIHVGALTADPALPGRIWLGAVERGVFRSLDSGRTWETSRQGLRASHVRTVTFDPVRPRTLYTAAQTLGVYRSTDAGRTWAPINAKLPFAKGYGVGVNTVAAHPLRPGTLFAGTGGGVYRSLDRGDHWSFVSTATNEDFNAFAFDPRQPDTIFAAGNILLRSRDGGSTWKRLVLPGTEYEPEIAKVIVSPLRPDSIFVLDFNQRSGEARSLFRSLDGGNTWKLVFELGPAALALHPTDPDVVYLATEATREIWRSGDGGLTWGTVVGGVGNGARLTSLLVDRLDPSILYVGTDGAGVWRSTNHGATWARLGTGLIAPRITCLEADPRNPRRILACTWGGGVEEIRLSSAP